MVVVDNAKSSSHDAGEFLSDDARALLQQKRERRLAFVIFLSVPAFSVLMFLAYWQMLYFPMSLAELPHAYIVHICLVVLANAVVSVAAFQLRGEFKQKASWILFSVVLVHGALVFWVLIARQYYSRPLLLMSIVVSVGVATVILHVVERMRPVRIGAVPTPFMPEVWSWVQAEASVIRSPDADVSKYDTVLVDWEAVEDPAWRGLLSRATLSGCNVQHVAKFVEERSGRVSLEHFEPGHTASASSAIYSAFAKRPLELALVLVLLPVCLPVLVVAMIAIRACMGRGVLFAQTRVGQLGLPFTIYKLRTMMPAEHAGPASATQVGDPRVTKLGRILRRYRIDEIPQLWNVLVGEMSLIGPRPEQPQLCENYRKTIPGFDYRHLLKPGITGWAQITTGYAATVEETRNKISYDLYYVKHVSLLLDMWILVHSLRAVILGNSAR